MDAMNSTMMRLTIFGGVTTSWRRNQFLSSSWESWTTWGMMGDTGYDKSSWNGRVESRSWGMSLRESVYAIRFLTNGDN
jgi:hypothetical protein